MHWAPSTHPLSATSMSHSEPIAANFLASAVPAAAAQVPTLDPSAETVQVLKPAAQESLMHASALAFSAVSLRVPTHLVHAALHLQVSAVPIAVASVPDV